VKLLRHKNDTELAREPKEVDETHDLKLAKSSMRGVVAMAKTIKNVFHECYGCNMYTVEISSIANQKLSCREPGFLLEIQKYRFSSS